jgi:fumigallin biosynthesis monooxygenase-like protein
MADIIPARMTHDYDGDLVVFLIGMRINKPWRPDLWMPVFLAMGPMLAELSKDKDSGLLGYRMTFGAGGPLLVQYWNSHEKLYAYASDRTAAHRPAWAAFNRRVRKAPGAVGIWHETYVVERAESIYSGVPTSGLAAATSVVPVARRGETARQRLAAHDQIESVRSAA